MVAERSINPMTDISKYRDDFPALKQLMNGKPLAFLDSAASAQKPNTVINAMDAVLKGSYANIHRGLYKISQNLTEDFEAVRSKVAAFIGAKSEKNIVFTRNATEAINLVAQSWGGANLKAGDEIILTQMEHHANIVPWQLLSKNKDIKIKVIPVLEDGSLDLQAFENLLNQRVRLLAFTHVSNALGTINPAKKIIEIARKFNPELKVLVDGSQAVVHTAVNVTELDADFYVFTGHKLYGPTGIGVLYGKSEILNSMPPYQGGGDMIEKVSFAGTTFREAPARFEAGTPAIIEVIGLGAAIDYVQGIGMDNISAHEAALLAYGTERLCEIPGLTLRGTAPDKAAILSFTMEGAHSSDIGMVLDQMGVAVRTGHHCCMPLMEHIGVDAMARASFALYSNRDDINQLVEGLHKVRELFK